ncbi:MAG: hypothetical protein ACJAU6_001836 [Alphaproteobacteria bacterium]|jgi:hypothetical protein
MLSEMGNQGEIGDNRDRIYQNRLIWGQDIVASAGRRNPRGVANISGLARIKGRHSDDGESALVACT